MFAARGCTLVAQPNGLRRRQILFSGDRRYGKATERLDQVKRLTLIGLAWTQSKPDADRLRSCAAILSNNSKCRPIRRLGGADHLDACSAPQTARPSQYPANSLDRLMTLQGVCMRLASAKPDASATARLRNPELDLSQLVTVEPRAVSGVAKIIHTTLARLRRGGFHEYD